MSLFFSTLKKLRNKAYPTMILRIWLSPPLHFASLLKSNAYAPISLVVFIVGRMSIFYHLKYPFSTLIHLSYSPTPFSRNQMDWVPSKQRSCGIWPQETEVWEVHQFFFVNKDHKSWRLGCHLCRMGILRRFPLSVGVGLMAMASIITSFKTAEGIRVFWLSLICLIILAT